MQPIDKTSSVPYYLQLAEILRRDIGERQSSREIYQLPSDNELAASQGITRATVRRALDVCWSETGRPSSSDGLYNLRFRRITMASARNFLALDLGAESGRAMLGQFDGERLHLGEIHRFPNVPVRLPDGLHWDILRLWGEVKQGIALALREQVLDLTSVGIDTWAVDFGLLDRGGALLSNPFHYRDSRTMVVGHSPILDMAETFLTIPDLLNYWLTGQAVCEFSNATTTQCYDPREQKWAVEMLQRLGIPTHIFPPIAPPGTNLGPLLPYVTDEIGLKPGASPTVIAPACHDTGSAVVAVPATAPDFAWISSGTWSVVGAEVPQPIINEASLRYNFTNEGGVNGTFRFSRNVMGLWLVQECRRTWAQQGEECSYPELIEMAAQARPFLAVIDPDYGEFFKPGDMPARIAEFCQTTGQPVPQSKGATLRCALEGIALKYRWVLQRLEEMLGRRLEPLYIVGGGTQNHLLSQFTADAVGRPVVTGSVEATATGNILMQMMTLGHFTSLGEGRNVVRNSFDLARYEPGSRAGWDEAYTRLLAVMEQTR